MRYLSNKEIKKLREILMKYSINTKRLIETEFSGMILYLNENKEVVLIKKNDIYFPALKFLEKNDTIKKSLKRVIIDIPAVKYIANGADIMRPGIKGFDEFNENEIVQIIDEKYGKTIAIGLALMPSNEMKLIEKGKVIKNLHWVGDKIYKNFQ